MKSKALKILLLTDRLGIGGAETHVVSLYKALKSHNHSVIVASCGGIFEKETDHIKINLASRSPFRLMIESIKLSRLIKKEKFDVIHAHARLPAFIAYYLSKKYNCAFLTTAHAKFKIDPLRKRLSRWGDLTCAVSEDLKFYLTERYSISPYNITVIENGIDASHFASLSPLSDSTTKKSNKIPQNPCSSSPFATTLKKSYLSIAFISRLDFDCSLSALLLCDIIEDLRARFGDIRLKIGGGGEMLSTIKKRAEQINKRANCEIITLFGSITDSKAILCEADIFVGVSRAAIEAAFCALPVIISGNEGFIGRLSLENYRIAKSSNFCARGSAPPTTALLSEELSYIIKNYSSAKSDACALLPLISEELDISKIVKRYENFYHSGMIAHRQKNIRYADTMLFGYYGYRNLGDDALLKSAIARAKSRFGDSVGAFTHAPRRAERDFLIKCRSRKNPFSLFWGIFHSKRIIFGGGTLFQCSTSKRSLLFYIFILLLAQKMGKETELWANGIDDIPNCRLKALLLKALEKCDRIGVRDDFSLYFLKKSLKNKNIIFEKDLALSESPSSAERAEFLVKKALQNKEKDFFIVCVKRKMSGDERFILENEIKKEKLAGRTPIFIICSPSDIFATERMLKKFGGGLLENLTFSDLLALSPIAKKVISARFHPLLAAKFSKTELKAIGSDRKLKEFF